MSAATPSPATAAATAGTGGSGHMTSITARAGYMMGANVEREWTPEHAAAWEGFLELGKRVRRDAEDLLDAYEDLGVSGLGILGRLARAENRTLRQTGLAEAMGLSLSRVSRLVDALEARQFVERQPCPGDARATNVVRYLMDECQVPGERLVASGYSQYQPRASNRTTTGRRRNRRIELNLLPMPRREASADPVADPAPAP